VTFLADSYGPRGLQRLCPLPERDRPIKTDRERVRDAYGALLYIQSRKDVLARSVGVMGWSNGGQAAIWTIGDSHSGRPASLPKGISALHLRSILVDASKPCARNGRRISHS